MADGAVSTRSSTISTLPPRAARWIGNQKRFLDLVFLQVELPARRLASSPGFGIAPHLGSSWRAAGVHYMTMFLAARRARRKP